MEQSIFDPKIFQQKTFTESNSTESVPIPEGEWPFVITKSEIVVWGSKADPTKKGLKLVLLMETDEEQVKAATGRDKNSTKYEIMLDLTADGRGLDFGKGMNVRLGRAREACGINKPGEPFGFDMFVGRQVKAAIGHRALDDGTLVADVKGLAPMSGGYTPGA